MQSSFVGLVHYDPPQIRNPAWLKEPLHADAVLQQLFLPWLQALILLAALRNISLTSDKNQDERRHVELEKK
jgi:hypothetical protein